MESQYQRITFPIKKKFKSIKPYLMLVIRSILFLVFQAMIALIFVFNRSPNAWNQSAAWWMFSVILTDLVCLLLLIKYYRGESTRFRNIFRIEKEFVKKDLLFLTVFLIIAGPISYFPNVLSAKWLFGDPQIALDFLVRPLPKWAALFGLVFFPLLQGLVEIPTYMIYALPRLEEKGIKSWLAISLSSFFLSFQHIFVPFLPDSHFLLYRFVMFFPFAVLVAIVIRWRPRLMPYIAVIHFFMDISIAVVPLI